LLYLTVLIFINYLDNTVKKPFPQISNIIY